MAVLLSEFEANLERLLEQYAALEKETAVLRQANEAQRNELLRTHAEYETLKQKYRTLQTAHALSTPDADKSQARRQLTRVIDLVDKALAELAE